MTDERFPARCRLRRASEFRRVFERRQSVSDDVLIVYACENDLPYSRLGLSVSRKVGGAVVRNRWKRVLRDVFRRSRCELPPGLDLVVIPRRREMVDRQFVARSLPALACRVARRLARHPDGNRS
jgi:ribonuclease P protein component